jgi:uncharacterized protein
MKCSPIGKARVFTWLRSALPVTAAALFVLLTAGPSLQAQSDAGLMHDPTVQRGSLFGRSGAGLRVLPEPPRSRAPVRRILDPSAARGAGLTADGALPRPKVDPTSFVVVMGDTLGDLLAGGLDEALGDVPTAVVIRRSRADSGLVRNDHHDWPKAVRELLASDQTITVGVMLIGVNDRQAIREGDLVHEPLSERWREMYRDRVDAIAQAFSERRIPLIWVGAPPVQSRRLSADLAVLNDIFRQRTERAGGVYVDLWHGFVDGENRYSAVGADLAGQTGRLRTGDGIHFTRAGARKAAHFADVALRRLLPDIAAGPQIATTSPVMPALDRPDAASLPIELQPGGVERLIDQMARLGTGLEPVTVPVIRVKPVAGPVLSLTGPALSPGGVLLSTAAAALGGAGEAERVFSEGQAATAVRGRADDFSWPRVRQ